MSTLCQRCQFMLFLELKNINNRHGKNAKVVHEAQATTALLFLFGSIAPPPPPPPPSTITVHTITVVSFIRSSKFIYIVYVIT